jgi:hypothetical protein
VHLLVILGILIGGFTLTLVMELGPWWLSAAAIALAALASLFDRSETATTKDTPAETEPGPGRDLTAGS